MLNNAAIYKEKLCQICSKQTLFQVKNQCIDYISNEKFNLLKCNSCGCYFTEPPLNKKNTDYYGEEYYNKKTGKFSPLVEYFFKFNHRKNARKIYSRFNAVKILEVGCGRGYLLNEVSKLGADVYCLESSDAADWILENSQVKMFTDTNDKNWLFSESFFQLVILWHVFEHLLNPTETLKFLRRNIVTGGYLVISVPNVSSWQAKLGLKTWFHLDVPRHQIHFDKKSLIYLLKQNKFEIITITSGDFIQNLFGWFQSLANLFTSKRINSLYRLLQGGNPMLNIDKKSLFIQIITSVFWIPVGILGYIFEEFSGNHGTITIIARKMK